MKSRPGRALLTVLSVAIGVAAIVAVTEATSTTETRFAQMRESLASRAALEVVANGEDTLSEDFVPAIEEISGVRSAISQFQDFTVVYGEGERARVLFVGVDFESLKLLRDLTLVAGHAPQGIRDVLLEASLARSIRANVGDEVRLLTPRGFRPIRMNVAGIFQFEGAAAMGEQSSLILPLGSAQTLWRSSGEVTSIQIVLDEGANLDDVQRRIAAALPSGFEVQPPAMRIDLPEETVFLVQQSLNITSTLSVGAAILIILNTYLMNVGERQPKLAVIRLIGGTSGQLRRMLLREAVMVATFGTLLGLGLGLLGGYALTRGMESLFEVGLPGLPISYRPLLWGLLFGPAVTLVAMIYPAYRAGRTPPLLAMRGDVRTEREQRNLGWVPALGILLLTAGAVGYTAALNGWISPRFSVMASGAGLTGCVLLFPLVLRPAAFAASRLLTPLFPAEAQLAYRQLVRHAIRTTLTAGVIFVVVCVGIGIGNTVINVVNDIETWQEATFPADFLIRANVPRIDLGGPSGGSPLVGEKLEEMPGVASFERLLFKSVLVNGTEATLLIREYDKYDNPPADLKQQDPQEVKQRLLEGEAVVASVLANRLKLEIGDEIAVDFDGEKRSIRVAGIIGAYSAGGLVVSMDRAAVNQIVPIEDTHMYLVQVVPGAADEVGAALQSLAKQEGMIFLSYADFRRRIQNMISGVVGGLWLLLALGFLIAGFGIVNTLTMNVLEQTRELGVLRVVGTTQGQVQRTVLSQAIILTMIAVLPGLLGGVAMAWLSNFVFRALFAHAVEFNPQWWLVLACFVGALLLSLVAAMVPARRASRLEPLTAVRTE